MNLSDITKINFGAANISAVYNGGIKLWPTGTVADNKVMKFTIVSGDTWDTTYISAYTADDRLIEPVKKDTTGWTYDENVGYIVSEKRPYSWPDRGTNLLAFEGFPAAVKIKTGEGLFEKSTKCTGIATTNIDTSECTSMKYMFSYCGGLTSLNVSNFNTSQVTDMYWRFNGCSSLTSLDLSNFNTSQVTNMNNMFSGCSGLTSLDVSNFNTSQVTYMGGMFSDCGGLTSLDVSNFNTSQVTDMSYMFSGCKGLTTLDLSNFNTSQVTDMGGMFDSCNSLTSLDLSGWDMLSDTDTYDMFYDCSALKTVKMTNCSKDTKDKIRAALDEAGLTNTVITE